MARVVGWPDRSPTPEDESDQELETTSINKSNSIYYSLDENQLVEAVRKRGLLTYVTVIFNVKDRNTFKT